MPISADPTDWKDLQNKVSQILADCGMSVDVERRVSLVRGQVEVDVYAEDSSTQPPSIYLCECKKWSSSVPQTVVHSFRTIVSDSGANFGLLVSSKGFQQGAIDAAKNSNIKLLTWVEFQEMFLDRWVDGFFSSQLAKVAEPLVDYTEPLNVRVSKKTERFNKEQMDEFYLLREKYAELAFFALSFYLPFSPTRIRPFRLPISANAKLSKKRFPEELYNEELLRPFLDKLLESIANALAEFDALFGERA